VSATASPIVKWVGGKTKLLDDLVARMPTRFDRYFEPFCGGAALFFRVAPERAVLADLNVALMTLYGAVRKDVEGVIRKLRRHRAAHCETYYYATRDRWNKGQIESATARAAAFLYFNKTAFNGLWRVNRAGKFNAPFGDYVDPAICNPEALRVASAALQRVKLRCADYKDVIVDAKRGDFVYFDPPYVPITKTANFTGYTLDGFTSRDQEDLAIAARELVDRGVHVMLSNSDTPITHELYRGFKIDRVRCARSINSDGKKRGKVGELIIIGGAR
jgi:DNA adenine methylase